jgi:hypothetical protein
MCRTSQVLVLPVWYMKMGLRELLETGIDDVD